MLAKVLSSAVIGIEAYAVEVEVDIALGLPVFTMVGLPEAAVRESKDRVKAAIKNSGYDISRSTASPSIWPRPTSKKRDRFRSADGPGHPGGHAGHLNRRPSTVPGPGRAVPGRCVSNRCAGALPIALAARDAGYEGILVPQPTARRQPWWTGVASSRSNPFPGRRISARAGIHCAPRLRGGAGQLLSA